MQLSDVVRSRRTQLGMSQRTLAARIGVSFQYLCDIEQGRREPSGDELLHLLATNLKLHPDVLYFAAGCWPPDILATSASHELIEAALVQFRKFLSSVQDALMR